MRFDICFIDHIEPQFITHRIELRCIRIMRCPYGIDIVQLHKLQVTAHPGSVRIIPGIRIAVVPVDAKDLDVFSIELQDTIFNGYLTESDLLPDDLTVRFYFQPIEIRILGRPKFYILYDMFKGRSVCHIALTQQAVTIKKTDPRSCSLYCDFKNTV